MHLHRGDLIIPPVRVKQRPLVILAGPAVHFTMIKWLSGSFERRSFLLSKLVAEHRKDVPDLESHLHGSAVGLEHDSLNTVRQSNTLLEGCNIPSC